MLSDYWSRLYIREWLAGKDFFYQRDLTERDNKNRWVQTSIFFFKIDFISCLCQVECNIAKMDSETKLSHGLMCSSDKSDNLFTCFLYLFFHLETAQSCHLVKMLFDFGYKQKKMQWGLWNKTVSDKLVSILRQWMGPCSTSNPNGPDLWTRLFRVGPP